MPDAPLGDGVQPGAPGNRVHHPVAHRAEALRDAPRELEQDDQPSERRRRQSRVVEGEEPGNADDVERPEQRAAQRPDPTHDGARPRVDTPTNRNPPPSQHRKAPTYTT